MGVYFGEKEAGFHEMDEVDFSDSELVYHVREALGSASSVSNTIFNLNSHILRFWQSDIL